MKKTLLSLSALFFMFFAFPFSVNAGACYEDAVIKKDAIGEIIIGSRVRDSACMQNSTVRTTFAVGTEVQILAEIAGWYYVEAPNGDQGWVGMTLIKVLSENNIPYEELPNELSRPNNIFLDSETFELEKPDDELLDELDELDEFEKDEIAELKEEIEALEKELEKKEASSETVIKQKNKTLQSLSKKLKGHILLQVENNGEAWYVHPDTEERFYMKDGPTAYEMMRYFGLGITNSDLEKLQSGDQTLNDKLKGKIVLQVEAHGEAFYIHPSKGTIHYLKDGPAAYKIMRELSLGITNKDLNSITSHDFINYKKERLRKQGKTESEIEALVSPSKQVNVPGGESNETLRLPLPSEDSAQAEGDVASSAPEGVNITELNKYWLDEINALRTERGNLRLLAQDKRWEKTATEWAKYMGENDKLTHTRPDGKSMHQAIDEEGLEFTKRNTEDGWKENYFTENISWGMAQGTTESVKEVLGNTLDFFLSEEKYNGPHYRTIYHTDWNSVGTGLYFKPFSNGRYKVYTAFHYGSLENPGQ